jgi:hypothetical protein
MTILQIVLIMREKRSSSVCAVFRPVVICCTVVMGMTMSLSVLLLSGAVSADSVLPLDIATEIVAATAAAAAYVFPGVTSLDSILRPVVTWGSDFLCGCLGAALCS